MGEDQMNKEEYFKQVINDVVDGKKKIRGDHPKDVKEAIDAFFHAGKMLLDTPEIDTIPYEYIQNLITTMANYPAYQGLAFDLLQIVRKDHK